MRGAARARRLARVRARAQRLVRRRDQDRGADRARLPPRRLQRLAPALGRRRRARRARRRARGARARVPQHRAADGDGVPRRRRRLPPAHGRGERARSSGRSGRACSSASSPTPTSPSASSAPSSGRRPGWRSPRRPCGGSAARARSRSSARSCSRAATGSRRRSPRSGRTACSRRGCCTRGLGPDQATSGFMTQVIAVAVQEGGMPVPRGGGAKLADALVQLIRDHGGVCETDRDVERVLVRSGRAVGVRLDRRRDDRGRARRHRERDADPAPRAPARRRRRARPGREGARRFRYGRSEMQIHYALSEPPRWDGDERLGGNRDRPRHAGSRRRLARGERGRARAAAGGGDRRRRPAADDRPVRVRPRVAASSGSSCRSCRGGSRATPPATLDVGDGEWTDELRERYADRIQERLARHIPNLESSILKRVCARPARPAAGERQPPARRSVRRLARARPELPLAAVRRAAPGTRRRSSGSGRSARAPGRARVSAPARGRSSRGSCSSRR